LSIAGSFTLAVESEKDIPLLAELLKRKKGAGIRSRVGSNELSPNTGQQTSKDTDLQIHELLKELHGILIVILLI